MIEETELSCRNTAQKLLLHLTFIQKNAIKSRFDTRRDANRPLQTQPPHQKRASHQTLSWGWGWDEEERVYLREAESVWSITSASERASVCPAPLLQDSASRASSQSDHQHQSRADAAAGLVVTGFCLILSCSKTLSITYCFYSINHLTVGWTPH